MFCTNTGKEIAWRQYGSRCNILIRELVWSTEVIVTMAMFNRYFRIILRRIGTQAKSSGLFVTRLVDSRENSSNIIGLNG